MVSLFDFIFKDRQPKAVTELLEPPPADDYLSDEDLADLTPTPSRSREATGISTEAIPPAGNGTRAMGLDEIREALDKIAEIIREDEEKEAREELTKGNFTSVSFSVAQIAGLAPNLFRDADAAARIKDRHASVLIENLYAQLSKGRVTTTAGRLLDQIQEDLLIPDYLNHRKSDVNIPLHLVVSSVRPDELMKRTSHTRRDDQLDDMPNLFSRPETPAPAAPESAVPPSPAAPPSRTPPVEPPVDDVLARRNGGAEPPPSALVPPRDPAPSWQEEEDPLFNRSRLSETPAPQTSIIPPSPSRIPPEEPAERMAADELAAAAMNFEIDDSVSVFKMASSEPSAAPPVEPSGERDAAAAPEDEATPHGPPMEEEAEAMLSPEEDYDPDLEDAPTVMLPDPAVALAAIEAAKQYAQGKNGRTDSADSAEVEVLAEEPMQRIPEADPDIDARPSLEERHGQDSTDPVAAEPESAEPESSADPAWLPMEPDALDGAESTNAARSMEADKGQECPESLDVADAVETGGAMEPAGAEAAVTDDAPAPPMPEPEAAPASAHAPATAAPHPAASLADGELRPPSDPLAADEVVLHGVDFNRATEEELAAVPGLHPRLATRIVRFRDERGPFASVDGLALVPGMGPAAFEALTGRSWSAARDFSRQTLEYVFGPASQGAPDLRTAAERFAGLPGFEGCIFTHEEGHVLAAHWDHPQQEMLSALAPQFFKKIESYGSQLNLGDCNPISMHLGERVVTIVQGGDVFLALIHAAQHFDPRRLQLIEWAGAELAYRMQSFQETM